MSDDVRVSAPDLESVGPLERRGRALGTAPEGRRRGASRRGAGRSVRGGGVGQPRAESAARGMNR